MYLMSDHTGQQSMILTTINKKREYLEDKINELSMNSKLFLGW
jgi:hypothetical protein